MKINSYNKYGAGRINRVQGNNFVDTLKTGENTVAKVSPVKEVSHGFNANALYLVKLSKLFKNEKKFRNKKKRFKEMDFFEFKDYIINYSDEILDGSYFDKNIRDKQLLFLKDILSSIEDDEEQTFEILPIVIDEEVDTMNVFEFRLFLSLHKELFNNTGLFHYEFEKIENLNDEQILEIKNQLLEKIKDLQDLFYYNKAFSEYEKSYNNLAEFNSSGIKI